MPTDADFIAAIAADPDDDAPRLKYARWLTRRGDRRGEYIELQVEAARLPPDTPERGELERRAASLRKRYPRRWVRDLEALGCRDCVFRRGLIEEVTIGPDALERNAERLFRLAPIRRLALSPDWAGCGRGAARTALPEACERMEGLAFEIFHPPPELLLDLFGGTRFSKLRALSLDWVPLDEGLCERLAGAPWLPRLTELALNNTGLSAAGIERLLRAPRLPRLEVLRLRGNPLETATLSLLGRRLDLSGLRVLDLSGTLHPEAAPGEWLAALRELLLPALQELEMGGWGHGNLLASRLPDFRWPRLRRLNLAANEIDDEGGAALVAHLEKRRLAELDLSNNRIGPTGVDLEALPVRVNLEGNTLYSRVRTRWDSRAKGWRAEPEHLGDHRLTRGNLRALGAARWFRGPDGRGWDAGSTPRFNRCEVGDAELAELLSCPDLADFPVLDLRENRIGPEGCPALVNCPHLRRLRSLDLSANPLGCDGLRVLVRSPLFSGLRRFQAAGCGIGPAGLAALAGVVDSPLEELDLQGNPVGDEGAGHLARARGFPHLRRLDLRSAGIGPAGVHALANAAGLSALRELWLDGNALDDGAALALAHGPWANLTGLSVGGDVRLETVAALLEAPRMANLTDLSLGGCTLRAEQLPSARQHPARLTVVGDRGSAESAFLRAIRDDPDNDDPRWVYSDVLEDRNDPWAEGIRVQLELARLPEDDPRRAALQDREYALLQEHSKPWLTPLLRDYRFTFRRGLPEELFLGPGWRQTHLEWALRLYPVVKLGACLSWYTPDADVLRLLRAEGLGRLRVLTLEGGADPSEGFGMSAPEVHAIGLPAAEALARAPHLAGLRQLVLCFADALTGPVRAVLEGAFGARVVFA